MRAEDYVLRSEQAMKWLELAVAYFLVALFAIGAFDLALSLYQLMVTGQFTDPDQVIDLIDTVLVLLIIVEVYQTVIAFSRDEPVVRIVINAALIAIARKVISFRPHEYPDIQTAFVAAGAFALLLTVLIAAFYVVRQATQFPESPREPEDLQESMGDDGSEDSEDRRDVA